jgi:ERCC4-related helicase
MLVLITLQKLAASSIAAIRNALRKRRIMLADAVNRSNGAASVALPDESQATLDDMAEAEEALPSSAAVLLMGDEIHRLDELIGLSDGIANETKIERLIQMISEEFGEDEPVLLFTEYKSTQALVVNALHRQFGFGSATFINGDERLDGLEQPSGATKTVSIPREQAADAFNAGKVRFLVSTEAVKASTFKNVVRCWFT